MSLKTFWYKLCIIAGDEICEKCGSNNVLQQGYEDMNHRHYCRYCGYVTTVHLP